MATITRGYTFSPTEQVTAQKLFELIARADISGISWSEYAGTVIGMSSGSPPAAAAAGWISAVYEPPVLDTSSYSGIFSEFNYVIETGYGPVALFKQTGLETRRQVAGFGVISGTRADGLGVYPNTPTASVTLTFSAETGNNTFGNPHCMAVLTNSTGTTSPTLPSGSSRMVIRGYVPVVTGTPAPIDGTPRFLFGDGSANAQVMGCTTSTSMDKTVGQALSNSSTQGRNPCFLYGAPIWRG